MEKKQVCVKLSVHPTRGLMDEKFLVLVQNAPPGFPLTVHALHHCEDGHSWEAFGHYTSSAAGTVNGARPRLYVWNSPEPEPEPEPSLPFLCRCLMFVGFSFPSVSEDLSQGGTYSGVEQMGLLWSLRPVPGSKSGLRLRKMNVQTPMEVTISVYQGHQTEGFLDLVPLTAVVVERWYMAPGVRRIPITEEGLTATLFLPPGPGPFPGILDLWGGAGKLMEYRAALLASHGFAAMALDYLTPKITLETGKLVTNEYFETAYTVLQQHPQVIGSRIAMLGFCVGAAMTFKMTAYSKVMKLRCAVCISGSHVQPVEGTVEDMLNLLNTNPQKTSVNELNQLITRAVLLPIPTDPAHKVDMGRIQCPLLVIVGKDDQSWAAYDSAMDIKDMMEKAGNSHLLSILSYPDTGHLIEPPYTPHIGTSAFKPVKVPMKLVVLWGGETAPHSHAQEDAWRKTLAFLKQKLFVSNTKAGAGLSSKL